MAEDRLPQLVELDAIQRHIDASRQIILLEEQKRQKTEALTRLQSELSDINDGITHESRTLENLRKQGVQQTIDKLVGGLNASAPQRVSPTSKPPVDLRTFFPSKCRPAVTHSVTSRAGLYDAVFKVLQGASMPLTLEEILSALAKRNVTTTIRKLDDALAPVRGVWLESGFPGMWNILPSYKCYTLANLIVAMSRHEKGFTPIQLDNACEVNVASIMRGFHLLVAGEYVTEINPENNVGLNKTRVPYRHGPKFNELLSLDPTDTLKMLTTFNAADVEWFCACWPESVRSSHTIIELGQPKPQFEL